MVLTIAFALVASAGAWWQCAALQMAAAAAHVKHVHVMSHHADAAGHGGHDHAMHHESAADEPTAPAADHDCMKCCTMCVTANGLLPAADAGMIVTSSAHDFFPPHKTLSGSILPVDPGIPKRIG